MMNLMGLMQMMQGGGNPMQLAQMFASQNPQAAPAMQMIQGKSPDQLKEVFYNLCKSKGLNPQDIARQCGVTLPQ
jgi:hypothetical protein